MNIELCASSVAPMLSFLRGLKAGQAQSAQLARIFDHPDYDFEFRRYQIAEKTPLIDYFMALPTIGEGNIPLLHPAREHMLRWKHPRWLDALENPDAYAHLLAAVTDSLTDEALGAMQEQVRRGLPQEADLSRIRVIITLSIGTSFGYIFNDALHVDLMGLSHENLATLPALLAHEIHHIAFLRHTSGYWDSLTPQERYILHFAGEGLAIKFCNNAKGALSKAIDPQHPQNQMLDSFTMGYLNDRFGEALGVFRDTLAQIGAGAMSDADVKRQMEAYWLNFHTEGQGPGEQPRLKQSLLYSFGNDLFGAIYDAHGAETLFDCLRHPLRAARLFEGIVG